MAVSIITAFKPAIQMTNVEKYIEKFPRRERLFFMAYLLLLSDKNRFFCSSNQIFGQTSNHKIE